MSFEESEVFENRTHHHFKGRARRSWDCKAGTDRKVDEEHEDEGEGRVHAARERLQTARLRHCHHAENRKAHGSDEKACERRKRVDAGLSAEPGRKDEVSCAEEHGEERESDEKAFPKRQ